MQIEYIVGMVVAAVPVAYGLYKVVKKRMAGGMTIDEISDTLEDIVSAIEEAKE